MPLWNGIIRIMDTLKFTQNPHDHEITWDNNFPSFGKYINYPDGAPEFKGFFRGGYHSMTNIVKGFPEYSFESISDFKWSMKCGGEVQFIWKGVKYCAFGNIPRDGNEDADFPGGFG